MPQLLPNATIGTALAPEHYNYLRQVITGENTDVQIKLKGVEGSLIQQGNNQIVEVNGQEVITLNCYYDQASSLWKRFNTVAEAYYFKFVGGTTNASIQVYSVNVNGVSTLLGTMGTGSGYINAGRDIGGTTSAPKVVGLQGRDIADVAPADGDVLTWDTTSHRWQPAAGGSGGGGGGSATTVATNSTGATIPALTAVNFYDGLGTLLMRPADPATGKSANGFTTGEVASSNSGTVKLLGALTGLTGLNTGAAYYTNPSTPGAIVTPQPEGITQYVGIALSDTELFVDPVPVAGNASANDATAANSTEHTIVARTLVNLYDSGGTLHMRETDITTSSYKPAYGFTTEDVANGASGKVRLLGLLPGFSGLTPGQTYYADWIGTSGDFTVQPPYIPNFGKSQKIGYAISPTVMMVRPEEPTGGYGFPDNPYKGQKWVSFDDNLNEYVWDSSNWVSITETVTTFGYQKITDDTDNRIRLVLPHNVELNKYLFNCTVEGTNNGTNYWTIILNDSSGNRLNSYDVQTDGIAPDATLEVSGDRNAGLYNTSIDAGWIYLTITKTGNPGPLHLNVSISYQKRP